MCDEHYQTCLSWTDDLPVCRDCGSAFSKNIEYLENGNTEQGFSFDDRSFYCRVDENTCLYGVFDGHYGPEYADFALQRITAEIVLGQLTGKHTDEEVKEVLRQAFVSVEKGYLDSIDELLAKRLQYELPSDINQKEIQTEYENAKNQLEIINKELKIGTSAVVALLYNNKLFVANVGTCRALLCRTDDNDVLRVLQLSVDHDIHNEDEELRLKQLGLDVDKIKQDKQLHCTRCIGSYLLKGGYRENQYLSAAITEPVIADPEIHGSIEIDDSCRFLLLMSSGLYKSLEEAKNIEPDQVNRQLAQMTVEQFRVHSTLPAICQGIIDKTVNMHRTSYLAGSITERNRDDITLLLRRFNYPLLSTVEHTSPKSFKNNISGTQISENDKILPEPKKICAVSKEELFKPGLNTVKFNPVVKSYTNNLTNEYYSNSDSCEGSTNDFGNGTNSGFTNSSTNSESIRSEITDSENHKIPSYVDFGEYYELVKRARRNGDLPDGIEFD